MRVYTFGNGAAEGSADMVDSLGGKGAGLAGMSRLGVAVPPGFTLPADACRAFYEADEELPEAIWPEVQRGLDHIAALRGRRLGDPAAPLLVSVRSGAKVSMPGMMDTVLNVGLNDETLEGLAALGDGRRFAVDSFRRFIEMYAEVAMRVDPAALFAVRDEVVELAGLSSVRELPDAMLEGLIVAYLRRVEELAGRPVPTDPQVQLREALAGVFRSWHTRRARQYRAANGIADGMGTAATVQAMVFGNLGDRSSTGVAFTRCPNTGEDRLFGEYLPRAQGEDVVSGAFTPRALADLDSDGTAPTLQSTDPDVYGELEAVACRLEQTLGDVQDLEFTIEEGRVWMLQTRVARRSARAAVRFAVDMAYEGLIDEDEALRRVEPERLTRLLHPSVDVHANRKVIAKGLPASPGAVSGVAVFDPDEVVRRAAAGERVVLVRVETSTNDMEAIRAASGVLTARGGMTSHAALVARGLGRCCVTGCAELVVNERAARFTVRRSGIVVETGTWITIDGSTGEVMLGEVATLPADPPAAYHVLMGWADARRRVEVRANADNAAEATAAIEQGCDGIGLCRTEHMFQDAERLLLVREMVFAERRPARRAVVERILPLQREDFRGLFAATGDRPLAIRLLDLPLHDLMPETGEELEPLVEVLSLPREVLAARARALRAANPLLGHRGCRLGLTFPEVYEIQVRAIFEALLDQDTHPPLQIVLPLVTLVEEVRRLRRRIDHIARQVCTERGAPTPRYTVGPMIESPRACLVAGELASASDFFIFGTNDLTSAVYCVHREDAGRFLPFYLENDVLPADPFVKLDRASVGTLIELAIHRARASKPGLLCGLAGVQASHPDTVDLCHDLGIDYVSCAPHRVPVARLSAARATLDKGALG